MPHLKHGALQWLVIYCVACADSRGPEGMELVLVQGPNRHSYELPTLQSKSNGIGRAAAVAH